MNDLWITISISVITNGGLLGLFIFVFKRLFDSALAQRAEQFKQELDLINKKYFYQYSKLYDEQAQMIKEVSADLVDMIVDVEYLVYSYNFKEKHPELFEHFLIPKDSDPIKWDRYNRTILKKRDEDIKANEVSKRASAARRAFIKNRIYFSKTISDKIERLLYLIWFIADTFQSVNFRDPYNFEQVVAQEVIETWHNAIMVTRELLPELEESFRKYIGVNELEKQKEV